MHLWLSFLCSWDRSNQIGIPRILCILVDPRYYLEWNLLSLLLDTIATWTPLIIIDEQCKDLHWFQTHRNDVELGTRRAVTFFVDTSHQFTTNSAQLLPNIQKGQTCMYNTYISLTWIVTRTETKTRIWILNLNLMFSLNLDLDLDQNQELQPAAKCECCNALLINTAGYGSESRIEFTAMSTWNENAVNGVQSLARTSSLLQ